MSLLERLAARAPAKLEQKADRLLAAERWGEAKLGYENALVKLTRRPGADVDARRRLETKIRRCRNALAREHRRSAEDLLEGGFLEEAREMLVLAIEVSADPGDRNAWTRQLNAHAALGGMPIDDASPGTSPVRPNDPGGRRSGSADDEYFIALCHTLPDAIRRAYRNYGETFKRGYCALNRGDFARAARLLEQAHDQADRPDSHIALELATAYVNLDRSTEARRLLTSYLRHHPDALPAYRLLCEIHWDQGDFDHVLQLLAGLPPELAASRAAAGLEGATFERAGRLEAARDHYRHFLDTYGWESEMAHRLARVYRDLNETQEALELYGLLVDNGGRCTPRTAPPIRYEYAELRFEQGARDTALLEMYLILAREIPSRAAHCYTRVAHIYSRQGHAHEARRFQALARRIEASTAATDRENNTP
jgi:tetratricopeptide (TPR) repeat protein